MLFLDIFLNFKKFSPQLLSFRVVVHYPETLRVSGRRKALVGMFTPIAAGRGGACTNTLAAPMVYM